MGISTAVDRETLHESRRAVTAASRRVPSPTLDASEQFTWTTTLDTRRRANLTRHKAADEPASTPTRAAVDWQRQRHTDIGNRESDIAILACAPSSRVGRGGGAWSEEPSRHRPYTTHIRAAPGREHARYFLEAPIRLPGAPSRIDDVGFPSVRPLSHRAALVQETAGEGPIAEESQAVSPSWHNRRQAVRADGQFQGARSPPSPRASSGPYCPAISRRVALWVYPRSHEGSLLGTYAGRV